MSLVAEWVLITMQPQMNGNMQLKIRKELGHQKMSVSSFELELSLEKPIPQFNANYILEAKEASEKIEKLKDVVLKTK